MNEHVSTSSTQSGLPGTRDLSADFCAVLLLDAGGRVTGANASARQLWQVSERELFGEAFAAQFAFEVVSSDPDFIEAQWDVVLASALDRTAALAAQPREGAPIDVRVRIERPLGGIAGYIATIRPAVAAVSAAPGAAAGISTAAVTPMDEASQEAVALALLAEKSPLGFFDLNLATGRCQYSPAWKKLLGYAPTELPDTLDTWHRLIHPADSAAAPDKMAKKLGGESRPFAVEFRMRHHHGHWAWVQCTGVQVTNAAGDLERVVGVHLDITERKELEDALVANDARLQDLTGPGPLAAFELDFAEGRFWFSPAWERLLGYDEGELTPTLGSFAAALPAEDAGDVTEWLLARSPGDGAFVEPAQLRARDGALVPVLFGAHRVVTRKRELVRMVGFACSLANGSLVAAATPTVADTAAPAALLETALATIAEGVIVADAESRILFINTTAVRILELPADQARGRTIGEVFRLVDRRTRQPAMDPVERAIASDHPLPLMGHEELVVGPTSVPIVWTARATLAADGKTGGAVIVFRNPDEMTLSPEELIEANRFESLGLQAGAIAHDFNNLLTTILGALSLAKDNRDYSALDDAEKACDVAKGLTKQLLNFAKGGTAVQSTVTPREIIDDALKVAAAATTAAITVDAPSDVEPVLVDRAQMLQVFQNLIMNALQAMPPPPHQPRLHLHVANAALGDKQVPGLAAGQYVEFEVRDNGSGIKPEHVEKIFDPFFTTKKHGTGLGLATVLSIVRKHGGQIALDTQVGVGTAFTVYLPRAGQAADTQARAAASLRFGTGRILLMDDDPTILSLTATMLESLEYKYDLARNGEEAIALYKRYLNIGRPYDAVIMDLTVSGGMGGDPCFDELKKLDPEVRAIVASGYDNEEMARQYLDKGFCGYLTKPYRVGDLGRMLKKVLG